MPLVLIGCVQASTFYSKLDVTAERLHGFFPFVLSQNKNSLDRDPCTVGAMLNALCLGLCEIFLSLYNRCVIDDWFNRMHLSVPEQRPIPSSVNSDGLRCGCNTVIYRDEGSDFSGPILCQFIF